MAAVLGDYDCDGSVTVDDALYTLSAALELIIPAERNIQNADMDKDGALTVLDVLEIQRIAPGLM